MKTVIFVRHAAVAVAPTQPATSWQLTANGRSQTRALAKQIAAHMPTQIITSHEPKAQQTGQILAAELGLHWQTAVNLHEHDRRGVPYLPSRDAFLAQMRAFFARPDQLIFGNETANEARVRFETAIADLCACYPEERLAIITHGTVLSLLVCHHNPQLPIFEFWQRLQMPDFLVLQNYRLVHPPSAWPQ